MSIVISFVVDACISLADFVVGGSVLSFLATVQHLQQRSCCHACFVPFSFLCKHDRRMCSCAGRIDACIMLDSALHSSSKEYFLRTREVWHVQQRSCCHVCFVPFSFLCRHNRRMCSCAGRIYACIMLDSALHSSSSE